MNLKSLLLELDNSESLKVMASGPPQRGSQQRRTQNFQYSDGKYGNSKPPNNSQQSNPRTQRRPRSCPLCSALHKPSDHYLSQCPSLPPADKKYLARARQLGVTEEEDDNDDEDCTETVEPSITTVVRRVRTAKCGVIEVFANITGVRVTLDSGAEANLIRLDIAIHIGAKIRRSSQQVVQADGKTPPHRGWRNLYPSLTSLCQRPDPQRNRC